MADLRERFGAIEAGGTKFICAVGDGEGQILESIRIATREPSTTLAEVFEWFTAATGRLGPLRCFGIGGFGPLELNRKAAQYGFITNTPKPGWRFFDLRGEIARRFGCPVAIDTDVNAAALAELQWGAGRHLNSLAYVTVGTGIGVGFVHDQRAVHGLVHPEAGHIFVRRHPKDADFPGICPFHGDCLEGLASGPAILARTGHSLAETAAGEDIWEIEGDYLGQLALTLLLTHSPQRIVFGGGVMKAPGLHERVHVRMHAWLRGYLPQPEIASASFIQAPGLGDNAGIKGALSLALRGVRRVSTGIHALRNSVLRAFSDRFGGIPDVLTQAPGRVNLIGEHTDYNDGFVLPCAIHRYTLVAARRRSDSWVHAVAADYANAQASFDLMSPILPDSAQPWSNYLRGMAALMPLEGLKVCGADLVIAGDLPRGAGLSSSASLEVAAGMALSCLAGETTPDLTLLARIAQRAEQEFASCPCGIMDQLAVSRCVANHALLLDCRSLAIEQVSMPEDTAVMIVHSGVTRELAAGAYAERRAQCSAAARQLQVAALRDASPSDLHQIRPRMDPLIWQRAHHVVSENARTLLAADYLRSGDLPSLGRVMAQSHASMRDDFAITVPAVDQLASILQTAIGERGGARMTGGGFGGAVVAILEADQSDRVMAEVRAHYRTEDNEPPEIFLEAAAGGVRALLYPVLSADCS